MSRARDRESARRLGMAVVLLLLAAAIVAVLALQDGGWQPAADPGPSDAPGDEPAAVERVVDGDTLVVRVDGASERVRLIGIDAPELARPADGVAAECWADEAAAELADLVDGQSEVRLEADASDRDRFGRLLRHVWIATADEWELLGERLVSAGAVDARSYPPDVAYDDRLADAERDARARGAGMWGAC